MVVFRQHLSIACIALMLSQCSSRGFEPGDDQSLNDVIDTSYVGCLKNADLDHKVRLVDPESKLTISFDASDPLLATASFRGELEIYVLSQWYEVNGPFEVSISDMAIEDGRITGSIRVEGVKLDFDGHFSRDRSTLVLWLEKIGTLNLEKQEPPSEEINLAISQ